MTTFAPRYRLLALLAALLVGLLVVLAGGTHPASAAVGPENRVRASSEISAPLVGPPQHVSAGQGRDAAGNPAQIVVATGVAAKTGDDLIRASDVRFTQDSIGATFKDGRSVMDTADEWAAAGRAPSNLEPIRIFEKDGAIHSLDNRRLFAGQYADVSLPYRWASPSEIAARNQTQIFRGTSVMVRFPG